MSTLLLALWFGILAAASPGLAGTPGRVQTGSEVREASVPLADVEEDDWSGLDEVLLLQLKHELTRQKVLTQSAAATGLAAGLPPGAAVATPDADEDLEELAGAIEVSLMQEHKELINASAQEANSSNRTQVASPGQMHAPAVVGSESRLAARRRDTSEQKALPVLPPPALKNWSSILQDAHDAWHALEGRLADNSTRHATKGATGTNAIGWVLLVGAAIVFWLISCVFLNFSSSQVPPEEPPTPTSTAPRQRPTVRSFFPGGARRPRPNTSCC